jgi:serine/threonine protein kinase
MLFKSKLKLLKHIKVNYVILLKRKVIKQFKTKIPRNQKTISEVCNSEVNQLREHNHENIIKYYDHFIENEHLFIVIEYCEVNLYFILKTFLNI